MTMLVSELSFNQAFQLCLKNFFRQLPSYSRPTSPSSDSGAQKLVMTIISTVKYLRCTMYSGDQHLEIIFIRVIKGLSGSLSHQGHRGHQYPHIS